jgi:hypothetical protein
VEQTDIEKLVGELEIAVDRLRSLYDQYFMGIEKLEPTVPRKDVDRRIYTLRKEQIRNTALRFRFQMLLQRYNTYQTHWQRICRDIENGTYKRHLIRAQQRFGGKRASARPPPPAGAIGRSFAEELAELDREFAPAEMLDDQDVELDEEQPTTPTRRSPSSTRTPRPLVPPPPSTRAVPPRPSRSSPPRSPRPPSSSRHPPSSPRTPTAPRSDSRAGGAPPSSRPPISPGRGGAPPPRPRSPAVAPREGGAPPSAQPRVHRPAELPDDRVRQLYTQYIEAKRRQNESTATITYDAVARSLRESSAKLRQRLGKPVDFEVAVKDGRAIIRPIVK